MNYEATAGATADYSGFVAHYPQIPKPVLAVILESPAWFDKTQKAAFERIVEMCPEIVGLVGGYSGTATPGGALVNSTSEVEFRQVRESFGYGLLTAVESVLLSPRCVDKGKIGPFTIIFIEPDATYEMAADAWVLKGHFVPTFLERAASRNLFEPLNAPVTYDFRFLPDSDVKYGPLTREQGSSVLRSIVGETFPDQQLLQDFHYNSPLFGPLHVQAVFGDDVSVSTREVCRASVCVLGKKRLLVVSTEDETLAAIVDAESSSTVDDIFAGLTDGLSGCPYQTKLVGIEFPAGKTYTFDSE